MECNLALARHPSGQVRAQLATEGEHVPHDVLELLVCDLDATVAQAASHAMASRTSSTDLLDLLDAAPSHPAAPRPAAPTNEAPPAGTPAAPSETREGI
ncbi:hypothetical protein ACFWGN_15055 [Oerskovia sp. NPDC060338]|uniref:hypothetical protein n=1 Tax=Oerskovia sp. NPDC060338 TaxID=3347100 RepID=UPI00364A7022